MGQACAAGGASVNAVRILRLAAGGDGVGKLGDGRTVFVPRTAPGDLVELTRVREHRRFARARIGRLVETSLDRVEPPCRHYVRDECGGCQLQHLSAPAQREARRGAVSDALRRIGGLTVGDPELVPSETEWEYRSKLTLHNDGRRIGLHPLDRPAEVFDLETCPITDAALMRLWGEVRRHRALLPKELEHIVLRLDRDGRRHLIVQVKGAAPWVDSEQLWRALAAAGLPATLWWRPEVGAARAVAGSADPFPATVFEQVHPAMGDRARAHAVAAAGDVRGRHVWDLYAGIGETTLALLAHGATVESVESDRRAVSHADQCGPIDRARVVRHAARVEDVMPTLRKPQVVITNPPRTGMDARAAAALASSAPERIVYISCDPATLARDIARIGAAYRLADVRAFDLFPQTAHVEAVALLERG